MRRFYAILALFGLVLVLVSGALPAQASNGSEKVFVCKYVGTPGVDERLQTGQNPIDVSVNAIGEDPVVVGSYFNDAQGRSYVLAFDTGQPDPEVSECPGSTPSTTTSTVAPTSTTVEEPTSTTYSVPPSSSTTTTEIASTSTSVVTLPASSTTVPSSVTTGVSSTTVPGSTESSSTTPTNGGSPISGPPSPAPPAVPTASTLPFTGSGSLLMIAGLGSLAIGTLCLAAKGGRRR